MSKSIVDKIMGPINKIIGLIPVGRTRELTALKNELTELKERYKTLTENLSAGLTIHSANGKINYCSPYIEVLTGYSCHEVLSYEGNFLEFMSLEEDREKVARSIKISQYGEPFQFRYKFRHKTGLTMWAETRIVPLVSDSGVLEALLSITFDITGSMRYQEKVEEHNQDLKDFSYMISHDLKSPLVTVRGMITACLEDFQSSLPEESKAMLSQALLATDRLDRLVKGVLDYAQLTNRTSTEEVIDGNGIVQEVLQEKQQKLTEIVAKVDYANMPKLIGDRTMLYQVFANIIGNAIKYRSPDRVLELKITAHAESNQKLVRIDFVDNGRGIPENKLNEIFRPFQRAHGKDIEGAGIGLASVKKLVERMGGKVAVQSIEGSGSTFSVWLRTEER